MSWLNFMLVIVFNVAWCGHCKKLAPIYDVLGKAVKSEKIVIAKMDATENDAPGVDIEGFPTIMLFKAKDNTIVKFSGDRTVKGFLSFLKENAVHATELKDVEAPEEAEETEEESEEEHQEL
jgi:protein disulfide-isomerase A1